MIWEKNVGVLYIGPVPLVTLDNFGLIAWPCAGDVSFKCLRYQLSMVGVLYVGVESLPRVTIMETSQESTAYEGKTAGQSCE